MLSWIVVAALATCPQGKELNGYAFTTQLKTLVVFREGFGFYVREGNAKLKDGWATTNLVPRAVAGTVWVYPKNAQDRIDTVVVTTDNRLEFTDTATLKAALADKVGLVLRLTAKGREVVGQLTHLLDTMMLLKLADGSYSAIDYVGVERVSLAEYPVRVKVRTQRPNGDTPLGLAYIQEGVRWEPSYVLELLPGKRGRLTLRGTLLDLPEELKAANVVFVVGAPVLSQRGSIDELFQQLMGSGQGGMGGGGTAFAGNRPGGFARDGEKKGVDFIARDPSDNSLVVRPLDSQESGELQYYTKSDFSLRPGEKALATIFEIEIPVTPLFEWNADGDQVTYMMTLENTSKQPFTKGPVFVVESQRPVGQQQIEFTAPGGKAELRLAKGIGLKVERFEIESKRGEPFKVGDQNFLTLTLGGKLSLENFRPEAAEVRVTRTVSGKVLTVGSGGKVKNTSADAGMNATNVLEWTVTVPAGGKLALDYAYEKTLSLGR